MRYQSIYIDPDGESHFGEVEDSLTAGEYAPPAPPLYVSEPQDVDRAIFFKAPVGWIGDWHPTPVRQLYVGLAGELEITVSSGETRNFGPGSVLLLEDIEGRGHVTKVVGDVNAYGLFVHLR